MVISHDLHFLNVQRTEDPGVLQVKLQRQITSHEEAEALLLGRDPDDFEAPPEEDEMQAVTSALLGQVFQDHLARFRARTRRDTELPSLPWSSRVYRT